MSAGGGGGAHDEAKVETAGGKIITFYSYKGGTGRTMLLANVAWILASRGKRVLVIDWDLEAPGMHRYFAPFLPDRELTASPGLIDMVIEYASEALTPVDDPTSTDFESADILQYASSLAWSFNEPGTLDLVPAGRQGPSYAARVNSFNWQNFYDRLGGGAFLDQVKENLRASYDYVLIDSRTGVSDTAGICTVELPDALVVCFTLNNQSIEGASAVARSVVAQRSDAEFRVFPVPTRVEEGEKKKLEIARDHARARFREFLHHVEPSTRDRYWGAVEVPYKIFYAYEEILACFGDRPDQPNSLLASAERLAGYLTKGEVTRLAAVPEDDRRRVLGEFERVRRPKTDDAHDSQPDFKPRLESASGSSRALAVLRPVTNEGGGALPSPSPPPTIEARRDLKGAPDARREPKSQASVRWLGLAATLVVGLSAAFAVRLFAKVGTGPGEADAGPRAADAAPTAPPTVNADVVVPALATTDTLERLLLVLEMPPETVDSRVLAAAKTLARGPIPTAVLRGHAREPVAAIFTPDGKRVVTGALDGTVRVWSSDGRGEPRVWNPNEGPISSVDVASNVIAAATDDGGSWLWPLEGEAEPLHFLRAQKRINTIRLDANAGLVLRAPIVGEAYVWRVLPSPKALEAQRVGGLKTSEPIVSASFAQGGVITQDANRVTLWGDFAGRGTTSDVLTPGDAWQLGRAPTSITIAVSPSGDAVAAAGDDGTLRAWRIKSGRFEKPAVAFKGQAGGVGALAVTDGVCVSGLLDGAVQLWRWGEAEPQKLGSHLKAVRSIAFSPDRSYIVTASDDGTARVLAVSGKEEIVLKGSGAPLLGASFAPDGERVVTFASDKTAWIWRVHGVARGPSAGTSPVARLRASTTVCLTARQRVRLLRAPQADARRAYEACETSFGRAVPPVDDEN